MDGGQNNAAGRYGSIKSNVGNGMEKIWEFFENLKELVYVTDMDSYELVYMNRHALKAFGIGSLEEAKGKKCYEVLQGNLSPCSTCTNKSLREGCFEEWKFRNPVLGRNYSMKDTVINENGKRLRMEMAFDIGDEEPEIKSGSESNNEAMINEGLRLALASPAADESLAILVEYLGHCLKSERVYIFEEMPGRVYNNTYEWCAKGVTPQKENLQNIPYEVIKLWYQRFQNNEHVIIRDVESICESDPAVYQCLRPQGIHSLVVSPLIDEKRIIGFYGVDNPPGELLDHISTMLQIMGHFIVSLLRKQNMVKSLERISLYDQLTKLGNRHAMHEYIRAVDAEKSIGVMYCDVMGLKRVNDEKGHQAGDDLLVRASQCLLRQFEEYALFRIGGDEFLVLCAGIGEEEMNGRIAALKQDMEKNEAMMAIGCIWNPDSAKDMDKLMAEADNRMYADKRAYYTMGKFDRRR